MNKNEPPKTVIIGGQEIVAAGYSTDISGEVVIYYVGPYNATVQKSSTIINCTSYSKNTYCD